jgi:anti-sigma regulatory factor (Ser/Thr protein kinase)
MARGLDVSFHYLGQPFAPPDGDPDFSGASEGGFGLYIVRNSVDEVSYDTLGFGVQRIQLSKHRRRDGEAARETP